MCKNVFKSSNDEFIVKIDNFIINNIEKKCSKAENNETGGILIGKYLDKHNAVIIEVTGPTKDSKKSRYSFKSGVIGLIELLDRKWNLGQYYIGEWHSHPNSSPQPSLVDDKQMYELSIDEKLNCPEPILLIIGGNQYTGWKISVHVYTNNNKVHLVKQ